MVAIISQTKLRSSRRRRKKSAQIPDILRLLVLFLLVFFDTLWIMSHKVEKRKKPECRERKWRSRTLRRSNKQKQYHLGIIVAQSAASTATTSSRKMSSTKNPIYFMHIGKTGKYLSQYEDFWILQHDNIVCKLNHLFSVGYNAGTQVAALCFI